MSHTKSDLLEAKTQLIAYVVSKIKSGDWHAVQDGASDIREIDAKLQVLNEHTHDIERYTTGNYTSGPSATAPNAIGIATDTYNRRIG